MTKEEREASIQSLLVERRGYEQRGLDDRVADVDKALAQLGYEAKTPKQRSQSRPASRKGSTKR